MPSPPAPLATFATLLLALALPATAQSTPVISGFLTGRTAVVRGQPSWIEGGFGRLDLGARDSHDTAWRSNAVAQLGADWAPTSWLNLHAQVLGRAEPSTNKGRRGGVVEAFAEVHSETWQVRAGEALVPHRAFPLRVLLPAHGEKVPNAEGG